MPSPPVLRNHSAFSVFMPVAQQVLAQWYFLTMSGCFSHFSLSFCLSPSVSSFLPPGRAVLDSIQFDEAITLPPCYCQNPECGKFCAEWPEHQKLLGISNFGIETLQVCILGIANQFE